MVGSSVDRLLRRFVVCLVLIFLPACPPVEVIGGEVLSSDAGWRADTAWDMAGDTTGDAGQTACPPGKWFNAGEWWCILCSDDGMRYANDGLPVDDGNACTQDACEPEQGVTHVPIEGPCWIDDPCIVSSTCIDGVCVGTPVECDDGSPCTDDLCDSDTGTCEYVLSTGPCDDGNPVTPDDTCVAGACVGVLDADQDGVPNYSTTSVCKGSEPEAGCRDNCPFRSNPDQSDWNNDGIGDACQEDVRNWYRVETDEKVVALTFDDGYNNAVLMEIQETLNAAGAYGTFFINGLYVEEGTIPPESLAKIVAGGHQLGNHTFHHTLGDDKVTTLEEIQSNDAIHMTATGLTTRPLFRSPAYAYTDWLWDALVETGFTELFYANVDPKDWRIPSPPADRMAECLGEIVEPGDILLFHVGPATTPSALAQVIKTLSAKGYHFVTLEHMLLFGEPVSDLSQAQEKLCDSYYNR